MQGAEAIVVTASGCGVMVKEYGHLLARDPAYASKAARVAELARDPVEVIGDEWKRIAPKVAMDLGSKRVAFHSPCTLQHGQKLRGRVEELLRAIGHELVPVADAHLCCGSAGTYSILQPEIAKQLRRQKLTELQRERPEVIATANIGCQTHLAGGTARPVRHWIELLDEKMLGGVPAWAWILRTRDEAPIAPSSPFPRAGWTTTRTATSTTSSTTRTSTPRSTST
jgi:glycolate oxidase iron-sulfur subunit